VSAPILKHLPPMPALPASANGVLGDPMIPSKSSCFGGAEADFEGEWARLDSNVPAKRQIIALKVAPG
jgi:hypothetical protein